MNPETVIDDILRREGSRYVNHPADRGGPTKYGITQRTLSDYRGYQVQEDEIKNLQEHEARHIYMVRYIISPGFYKIHDDNLAALVIDSGVNHGPSRVVKWLQEIVGVETDGILGPLTAKAINEKNSKEVFKKLLSRRVKFYGELVRKDHSQAVFIAGWLNRAMEFMDYV